MATPPELARDLRAAAVPISDIWELVNAKTQYKAAIPVLIDWLRNVERRVPGPGQSSVREGLVRALSVPAGRPGAAPALIEEFRKESDPSETGLGWVIGNALSIVADDSVFEEIAALAQDPGYGKARQMIVLGLGRSKDPRAVPLLVGLLGDEDVAAHAVTALGRLRPLGVRPAVERLLDHPRALVRREAKKALARLPAERS
jgi:HEAT repeat protein